MGGKLALRRFLLAALAFLTLGSIARANQAAQGWCESGAQVVLTSGLVSTTTVQASYPACTVTVFVHGGGLATIYSDNNATPTPLANPFTASVNGQWKFYSSNGRFDIQLSGAGFPSPVTYSDVTLFDGGAGGIVFGVFSSVSFSPTPIFNAATASIFSITLSGNVTSSTVLNPVQNGQVIEIYVCQDVPGGHSFAFPANFTNTSQFTLATGGSTCSPTSWWFNGATWQPFTGGSSAIGIIPPSQGGTGSATPTAHGVAVGEGASTPFAFITPTNNGQCFMSAPANFATTDPSYQSCPTGSGGTSAGPQGTLNAAGSVAGTFQTSALVESAGVLTNGDDNLNRGPNPNGVDIRYFGALPTNGNAVPATTCTINATSNSMTVGSPTGFSIGGGVACVGAGVAQTMTTPAAPTVVPSGAASLSGTAVLVNSPTASTIWSYKIAMCDVPPLGVAGGYGCTAASAAATITNGLANLGMRGPGITPITSIASGATNTFTAIVGSTAELSAGMTVVIKGTTDDKEFGGVKQIASVVDGTHFTYLSGVDASRGISTTTATGGTVYYALGNKLTLPTPTTGGAFYLIYGRTTGAYNLIGVSLPANLGYSDATYNVWEDYGATMSGNMVLPWWAPTTAPSSPFNDMYVGTITGIAGSTFTVTPAASTSVTSAAMRFDDVPAILAAYNASFTFSGGGGMLYFPVVPEVSSTVQGFVTSSYLNIQGSVSQASRLFLGATLKFSGDWNGALTLNPIAAQAGGFGVQGYPLIAIQGAYPGIYRTGGSWNGTTISNQGNGYLSMFDTSQRVVMTNNSWSGGNANDFMGVHFYRWPAANLGFGGWWINNVYSSGMTQGDGQTMTPFVIIKNDNLINMHYFPMSIKGMWFGPSPNGLIADLDMGEENQGLSMPLLSFYNTGGVLGGGVKIHNVTLDTSGYSVVASLPDSHFGGIGFPLTLENINQAEGAPIITGNPFLGSVTLSNMAQVSPNLMGQNINVTILGMGNNGAGGIRVPSVNQSAINYTSNHTLANNEGIVNAQATLTFTVDTTLPDGQGWDVYCETGTCTLHASAGTLHGNETTGDIVISPNTGMHVFVKGGNAYASGLVKPYAGTGAGIVTGPTSAVNTDLVVYAGTAGQTGDSGIAQANVARRDQSNTFATGVQDFSAVTEFRPKAGTTAALPATCTGPSPAMDVYLATDAQPGRNWYFCTATNVWTQQVNTGDLGLNTYATSHTLLATESWANFSATATATIPHALSLNRWVVYNTSASSTVTLAPDSGNITLNGITAATATIAAGLGVEVSCDGTNCFAWGLGGSGGGGSGTVGSCSVNGVAYYSAATTTTCVTPPAMPNGVPSTLTSTPSGGVSQPPALSLPGIVGRAVSGIAATDTILSTDCNPNRVEYVGSVAVAVTLPTAVTLGVPKCVFKLVNATVPAQTVTITPTTWTINGNATLALTFGQQLWVYVDPNSTTNWVADQTDLFGNVSGGAVPASAKLTGTNSSSQIIAATLANTHIYVGNGSNLPADVAASGDVTLANTGGFTVIGANGGAFPTSAAVLGTNSSKQPIAATAHGIELPLQCADTSGSGSAQVCNTTPTFTPVAGDTIIYTTTTANTGAALTINVNSLGAKPIAKWQTSTTLAASDIKANVQSLLTYDGTNWELATVGNAPSGGGGTPCTTTALSVQYNNGGAFGCMTEFTYASSTLSLSTTGKIDASLASVTAGFKLPSAAAAAPTAAGILSYDTTNNKLVVGNGTNTSTPTWITAAATSNTIPKASGTQGLLISSSLSDNGTTMSSAEPLALGTANCTTFGTAGGLCITEGTAPTNVASTAALYPDSTAHELEVATNGSTSFGMLVRRQPLPIHQIAQTGAITTATLCAASAGACNVAGQYHIHFDFIETGTACGTPATGGVTFLLTWTDSNATAHSAISLPMDDSASLTATSGTFTFRTTLAAAYASGDFNISTNGSVIQYATGYTACGVGTGTYQLDAVVTRQQ